ncbi:MAG: hypothetical protein DI568_18065 [Sphingomonas sp.]|nr:MAG: hypothetical protein DI568_18065 [Sphingomonas sp.]
MLIKVGILNIDIILHFEEFSQYNNTSIRHIFINRINFEYLFCSFSIWSICIIRIFYLYFKIIL